MIMKPEFYVYFILVFNILSLTAKAQSEETDYSQIENEINSLESELNELKNYVDTVQPTKHCDHLRQQGVTNSGLYYLHIEGIFIHVFCEFERNNSGEDWLIFQRRTNHSVDFYKNWKNYTDGFGNLTEDFWLGLENLYIILNTTTFTLRIDLVDDNGKETFAEYTNFKISNSSDNYRLSVGEHSGTAVDSLSYHNGMPFSTMDEDNDNWSENCAKENKGAWWYNSCYRANLNGIYLESGEISFKGIVWFNVGGLPHSKKRVSMKIRPT